MKLNKFLMAALAVSFLMPSCEDSETTPTDPEEEEGIGALYINEVSAKGDDFIELYNGTDSDINLNGYELNDGDAEDAFIITSDVVIEAGGFVVFVKGEDDSFGFGISEGDVITLLDADSESVDVSPALDSDANVSGLSWGRTTDGGSVWGVMYVTMGTSNNGSEYVESTETVVAALCINEVSAKGDDFVEIYNGTDEVINLNGYELNDGGDDEDKFIITSDVIVEARGFVVFIKGEEGSFGFGISEDDVITLLDAEGVQVDVSPALDSEANVSGLSWGRTTDGGSTWAVMYVSMGESNDGNEYIISTEDMSGALCLNEVSAKGEDFIEIYNGTDSDINLKGYELNDGDTDDDKFVIATDVVVSAKGFVVFVKGEDDSFTFGISDGDIITFLDADGAQVDIAPALDAEANVSGLSWGRKTDGDGEWTVMYATMGASNNGNEYNSSDEPSGDFSSSLCLNEVSSKGDDFIEIYNGTSSSVNLNGYTLNDSYTEDGIFVISSDVIVPSKGFVVFVKGETDSFEFGIGSEDIIVFVDADGNLVDVSPAIEDEANVSGLSWGRITDGGSEWTTMNATMGTSNNGNEYVAQ